MAEAAAARRASLAIPLTVGACFFMEGLDSTIIATALPQIAGALGISANRIGIALTAYLVSVSIWLAASGWLADRFEARRVFIAAIAVFMLGSLLCGLSASLAQLVAGRFLQGMGGALMTPVGRLILARSFPRDELVRAMSWMIVPGLVGPMLGPVVGGWIASHGDWRWIFFINLPLGLIGIGLALWHLAPQPTQGSARFDGRGFVLVAAALVALQAALEAIAAARAVPPQALLALGIGLVAALLYGWHARRPDPIVELRLLRHRTFAISVLGGSFSRLVIGATLFLFPLYFALALGAPVLTVGYLMGLLALGQIMLRLGLEPLLGRLGIKRLLIVNSVTLGALLLALLLFDPGNPPWLWGAYMFGFGLFHSVQLSLLAGLSFSGLPQDALGKATALAAVVQRLAMALGISLTAILLGFAGGGAIAGEAPFVAAIAVLAGFMLLSAASFLAMRPEDGADLIAKRR